MPSVSLQTIERETGPQPQYAVIWMHGLGANGYDFFPVVPELGLPASTPVRFVFPHAPEIPVTVNGGYVMPAWYDILSMDGIDRRIDVEGIHRSVDAVRELIAREVERGIPEEHIVLAGFSQGGVVSLVAGLSHPRPLAGIIALSTYLPSRAEWTFSEANRATPVLVAHGTHDPVVPYALGQQITRQLQGEGYAVQWHSYPMPHSVCFPEMQDLGAWLRARFQSA